MCFIDSNEMIDIVLVFLAVQEDFSSSISFYINKVKFS